MNAPPVDSFNRAIDYLRLSITDRCNLRCVYCMPKEGIPKLPHEEVLRYEEHLRLVRIAVGMGISNIRITGGEPLVRRGAVRLCEGISRIPGLRSLSMTTNGVLLSHFAEELFNSGVKRLNVSLDTLDPQKYATITRKDCFREVWRGIEAAHAVGFHPLKLNMVVMRGINDDEIADLARLTFRFPFHVRFIEFMPFRDDATEKRFLPAREILERLSLVDRLIPVESENSNGPALHFAFPGAKGKIGIISPVSNHFCGTCNRLRLTADGKLRACLFAAEETDLKPALRQGSDDEVAAVIRAAVRLKPAKHLLDSDSFRKCMTRPMSAIGG